MPSSEYLINGQKQFLGLSSASTANLEEEDEWQEDVDDELFNDFVILDKNELEKYNKPEKLRKESQKMQQENNECLIGRPGLKGEKVYLSDFKIKRVVDKGSFGKVFLVYNKKMKKLYAMKRINKDILI